MLVFRQGEPCWSKEKLMEQLIISAQLFKKEDRETYKFLMERIRELTEENN